MRSVLARKTNIKRGYLGADLGGILNTISQVADTANTVAGAAGTAVNTYNTTTGGSKPSGNIQSQLLYNQQLMQQRAQEQQALVTGADAGVKKDNTILYVGLGAAALGLMYMASQKNNKKSK